MDQKRVRTFENWAKGELNPTKQFVADFEISLDPNNYLHRTPLDEKDKKVLGSEAIRLCELVAAIDGVASVSVTRNQIRVYKHFTHEWREITKPIESAFKAVYGNSVIFMEENPWSLFVRRTRARFDLYQY